MKIVFASDNLVGYHKNWAGAEQACYRLGKILIKHGQELFFLTKKPELSPADNLKIVWIKTFGGRFFRKIIKKFMINFLPIDPVAGKCSLRLFKDLKPDLVHLNRFNELSFSLVSSAKKLNVPVVFSLYDFASICPKGTLVNKEGKSCLYFQGRKCAHCLGSKNKFFKILAVTNLLGLLFYLKKKITDYYFSNIDYFIVLSKSWVGVLEKYGVKREKIAIVPLPIFENSAIEESQSEANLILFVGWIYPHKGLHVLIKALPSILKEVPEARLHVVESGVQEQYKKEIIKTLQELKIEDKVVFLGKLPNDQVKARLLRAQAVAVPEQWGIAWPTLLTEAMACAKPVVASRIGDIPEFIKDGQNGFLIDPQNSAGFAQKLIWLLKNKEASTALGQKARADIMKLCDENAIADNLLNLYVQISQRIS